MFRVMCDAGQTVINKDMHSIYGSIADYMHAARNSDKGYARGYRAYANVLDHSTGIYGHKRRRQKAPPSAGIVACIPPARSARSSPVAPCGIYLEIRLRYAYVSSLGRV
jgi:hypothetical protein